MKGDITISVFTQERELPELPGSNVFHSAGLFRLYAHTPRHAPYMVVAADGQGRHLAHMLAVTRWRWMVLPPFFVRHCRITGEGDYDASLSAEHRAQLFEDMLAALTQTVRRKVFYILFSNLSTKMFGYRAFRREGFFPVRWTSIHNSLHSRTPEERIDGRTLLHIRRAEKRGAKVREVTTDEELHDFVALLRHYNRFKPFHHVPEERFVRGLVELGMVRLFLATYHGRAIGCCAVAYEGSDAMLWFLASLRKTYVRLRPASVTVFSAICDAHARGYRHFRFVDFGLPLSKAPMYRFVMRFGGKPAATFRWYRVSAKWLNALLSWMNFC